jgi:hypothetical protein
LWLIKNGIPFDVAFALDDVRRGAFAIAFSEMEGNEFDWHTMSFKETPR